MNECQTHGSLQANSKVVKFAAWPIRVSFHLALNDFHLDDLSELLHVAINIALALFIYLFIVLSVTVCSCR